jgi:hypothetical protein
MTPTPDAKGAQPEQFVRPAEEDERRALLWLTDVREHGGPLVRTYAATNIDTLAWFEAALSECRERERALAEQMQEFVECGVVSKASLSAAVRRALAAQPPSEASEGTP